MSYQSPSKCTLKDTYYYTTHSAATPSKDQYFPSHLFQVLSFSRKAESFFSRGPWKTPPASKRSANGKYSLFIFLCKKREIKSDVRNASWWIGVVRSAARSPPQDKLLRRGVATKSPTERKQSPNEKVAAWINRIHSTLENPWKLGKKKYQGNWNISSQKSVKLGLLKH